MNKQEVLEDRISYLGKWLGAIEVDIRHIKKTLVDLRRDVKEWNIGGK